MNFCMCGAQDGYQHDPLCPFPLYRADPAREAEWQRGWHRNWLGLPPENGDGETAVSSSD